MADENKLLTTVALRKPVKEMTDEEVRELARHVIGKVRANVPEPKPAEKPRGHAVQDPPRE